MAIKYISIKVGNRLHPYKEYQLTAGSIKTELIDTELKLVHLAEDNCEVLLHANDVRGDEVLRNIILKKCRDLKWKIWLFTHDTNRHNNINEFKPYGDGIVYTWQELKNSFPNLPQNTIDDTHSLRSQILTPFVALHLALQMNQEEQRLYLKNLSAEDRQLFQKGLDLLNNKDLLVRKFSELSGIPFDEGKALLQSQKNIDELIQKYAKPLSTVFQSIIDNNQIELPTGVDVLLAGIEQLSRIVEDGIEKSDLIKKARVIKHDLDNVMRRLDNCISPLSPEKLEVIKGGMERLDSIFKELRDLAITNIPHSTTLSFPQTFGGNPGFKAGCPTESSGHDRRVNGILENSESLNALKESLHLDMQNELDSASELIGKIREGVKTNLEESMLLELRDELVSVLQKPFNMIVSVTTGQEK